MMSGEETVTVVRTTTRELAIYLLFMIILVFGNYLSTLLISKSLPSDYRAYLQLWQLRLKLFFCKATSNAISNSLGPF